MVDPRRRVVASIAAAALDAVEPSACVRRAVRFDADGLAVGGIRVAAGDIGRVRVFGAGKAGVGLARGLLAIFGDRITDGLVVVKRGPVAPPPRVGPIEIRAAGHPIPDAASVEAAEEMLARLAGGRPDDLVVCPISGGASALLTAPTIALAELQALTRRWLADAWTIDAINARRCTVDRIKGGGLARAAAPARVIGLVLSDVPGDDLAAVGSGPTIAPDRGDRALAALVGCNGDAVAAAVARAGALGLHAVAAAEPLLGEARTVGRSWGARLRAEGPGQPRMWGAGGETTVRVRGPGRGGRNQELALAAIEPLAGAPDALLLALATDGEDGSTPAAGAAVDGGSLARARRAGRDPDDALARNDAHGIFVATEELVRTGPTGTNVGDLLLGFVF
jgi:hydroxypyruvate reductase